MKVWVLSTGSIHEGGSVDNVYGSKSLALHEVIVHMFAEKLINKSICKKYVTAFKLVKQTNDYYCWHVYSDYSGNEIDVDTDFAGDYVELEAFTI